MFVARRRTIALMKRFLVHPLCILGGAALLGADPLAAAEVTPVLLRCSVAAGQTNAYSVQVESQGEAGREAIAGTLVVSSRAVAPNFIGLSVRGQLRPKSLGGMPPMMGYRPGASMPLSSYTYGYPGQDKELLIDERGRILRQAGDLALPIPLGQLAASLVQPFPADATAGWESEEEVFVLDEPLLQGPAFTFLSPPGGMGYPGYFPGRGAQGVLAARQKTRVKVTEVTPSIVTLQKSLSLDSRLLTGSEPRVSAVGEGQIQLDRALGLPRRIELECKTVAVTENLSRRSMITLRWQLLEGTEREQAIAPLPAPAPETKFTEEEMAKLEEQLKSDDEAKRQAAARELSSSRLAAPTPELLSMVASMAGERDDATRRALLTILANHGAKEHVPLLLKGLNEPDATTRATVAKGLGRLRDPRAIEPLVNLLASGQSDQPFYRPPREGAAAEALVRIGTAAEPAVMPLLKEKNIETRCLACGVLKQIGTSRSLGPLKDLTANPNKELSEAAAEACRFIQSRKEN